LCSTFYDKTQILAGTNNVDWLLHPLVTRRIEYMHTTQSMVLRLTPDNSDLIACSGLQ
jgi:hypothetical protein